MIKLLLLSILLAPAQAMDAWTSTPADGSIDTSKLAPASVTASKLANAPVMTVGGASLIAALASGSTFFNFVADRAITLRRVSHSVVVAGVGGSGDSVTCNAPSGAALTSTTAAAAALGVSATGTGSVAVAAGTTVSCHIESAAATRPIVTAVLQYDMQ